MAGELVSTGKWYGLAAVFEDQDREFEAWEVLVQADGGMACPVCGEPLSPGPASQAGTVTRYCRFAGDHRFRAPGDVVAPRRGVRMGRFG